MAASTIRHSKKVRSERALTLVFAEMYVQGVSTRKVTAITEYSCGVKLNAMKVSRTAAQHERHATPGVRAPLV